MKHPYQSQMPMVPNRESITEQQISSLLAIWGNLQPYLLERVVELGSQQSPELDGGAKTAAVNTFVHACNRMDEILSQPDRWELKKHDELYKSIIDTHKKQQDFLDAQTASVKLIQRPSFQLKPTLAIAGEEYIAFFGDITKPGRALIGRGSTPDMALLDFDAAFHRCPEDQFVMIAGTEKTLSKNKKKKNTDETQ